MIGSTMSQSIVRPVRLQFVLLRTARPRTRNAIAPPFHRHASDFSHLHEEMTARRLPLVYDHISPTHSHLLNVSLADHLPGIHNVSKTSTTSKLAEPRLAPSSSPSPPLLSPTQHICYFPPPIPGSLLLPDGTDPLQSPGPPFTRRMWAGGRLRFNNSIAGQQAVALDGCRVVCVEGIRDVSVKGKPGEEKIFVGVERRVGRLVDDSEAEDSIRARLWSANEEDMAGSAIVERRNIVFLQDKPSQPAQPKQSSQAKQQQQSRTSPAHAPQHSPDYAHTLHPDPRLLFRYSALTFNAHAIHLDPSYCRDVEGHRGLLVHGPISITLLITMLRFWLFQGECASAEKGGAGNGAAKFEAVRDVEYRNLAPLYSGEPLRLCGRRADGGKYEVWAETPEGGLAVRGIVRTENVSGLEGRGPAELYEDLAMAVARAGKGISA